MQARTHFFSIFMFFSVRNDSVVPQAEGRERGTPPSPLLEGEDNPTRPPHKGRRIGGAERGSQDGRRRERSAEPMSE